MSRAKGVLGRLQRRVPAPENAASAHTEQDGDAARPPKIHRDERDVERLVEIAGALGPVKLTSLLERLPVPEFEAGNGVTVLARTKKERRRFEKPIEGPVLEWLASMSGGDVFFDVGANCGSLTLAAGALRGSGIRIVAIEPGYANFESLVRNLSRNRMLDFVIPLQIALTDRTGLQPINYYGSTDAGTSLHAVGEALDHEDHEFTPVEVQTVAAFTLDDAIEVLHLPDPTHVKVDVDGSEGALLRGAERTLRRGCIRDLLVEIVDHDRAGTRLASATALLNGHGYELAATVAHNDGAGESFVADYLFRRAA
jgi:FkbM family methyltransferase